MATFSTFQNRQFYVALSYNATVNQESPVGRIGGVKCLNDGLGKEIYFLYKGPETVLKSDRIQIKNLDYAKAFAPTDMITPLKVTEVTLDSNVNSGAPVAGQDYVIRLVFRQFYGMSDQDQYIKDAAVHATSAMSTAKDLFDAMVEALNAAFSREIGATKTSNPYVSFAVSGSGSSAKLVITEKIQDWTIGTKAAERVYFDVFPTTIYTGGDDVIWGKVADATPAKFVEDDDSTSSTYEEMIPNSSLVAGTNAIGNGRTIADMEYFYMGERGDQYRNIGWPNVVPTKYLADGNSEYYVLELHYAFTDDGVSSYRSEKDITIVSTTKATINSLIGAINSAAGTSIATLS